MKQRLQSLLISLAAFASMESALAGEPGERQSPRAAVSDFLDLCRAGRHVEAARYLALGADEQPGTAERAFRLKAVLDRHLWVDLSTVSDRLDGDPADGLPLHVDQLGTIPGSGAHAEPVQLTWSPDPLDARWVFSPRTVARIDAWYAALPGGWIRAHLPEALLRPGPGNLMWWQWGALVVLLALSTLGGRGLAVATRRLLSHRLTRTEAQWDDVLVQRLTLPLSLLWGVALAASLVPVLGLYAPAADLMGTVLGAMATFGAFWAAWRAIGVGSAAILASHASRLSAHTRTLVFVGARVAKAALIVLAVLTVMTQLGFEATGLLAGLGIGGLALALAAQKSVENLFGGVALAVDSPFGVGDFVRIEDFVGTVEAIGLRTTQFRTLDRTLITIPNGRLADMRLESFSARDRIRLACTIGLTYGTTAAQMRGVLTGLEADLRTHPLIWPDAVIVRFAALSASSLDIEVMAWFRTLEWSEFQVVRQEILLAFMAVVEREGASFAFPTQTVHLVTETEPRSSSRVA